SDCDDVREAHVVTRDGRQSPLEAFGSSHYRTIFATAQTLEYAFKVHACDLERWVRPDGADSWFTYNPGAHVAFETPAWARDAVFYQIFPDRFCRGDRSNNPAGVQPWGTAPA